ncbi:hypothetical protein BDZ90DRAFT_241690 [Jaminaea rosea]|uniref:Vacuole protein n=1 Tax=Jaminaea rosea TaxID=1569628 RepID=A0A316UP24_9BASI|nr:hypothetical protein BDZ90DRAFT_241690 [Jaminaea rosea]PWN26518.1 hypothetical protein BDZ90DRAFT_241690 [Jaminaea rosea]
MACCCGNAAWKREEVPDHKFDFIDVRDYHNNGAWTRMKYGFVFALVIKSFAVYIADIYTAVTLLAFNHFNGNIYNKVQDNPDNTVPVPIQYGKWVFFGCIIFSFLLLAYEAHKCRAIVRSRDISYAYTNVMANNYYSLRSYDHFCLFSQINNSTKKQDEIAFFIFFTFKGWKRLVVADGPRQVINALTLYGLIEVNKFSTNIYDYYGGSIFTAIMLLTMIFTVVIFAGSAILLLIASIMYLPLLCYIKGNLKEYCCHKIDKRITELVHFKKKERVARQAAIARAEAKGDYKHLMNKKGVIVGQKMLQPTLPKVDVDLFNDEKVSRSASPYGNGPSNVYGNGGAYGEDYGSQAHLVLNQGHAGAQSSMGHSNSYGGGHAIHDSLSQQPSLPPSAQTSPETYALHVKGRGGMPPSASSTSQHANLMSQLGPIGTSPQLFAQRSMGAGGGVVVHGNSNGSALAQQHDPTSYSRSPLAPADSNAAYQHSQAGNGSQDDYYAYHGQNGGSGGSGSSQDDYYAAKPNGHTGATMAGTDGAYDYDYDYNEGGHDARAYMGDLSEYAPYDDGQGGYSREQDAQALGDVYDAYAGPSGDSRAASSYDYYDQQNGQNGGQHGQHGEWSGDYQQGGADYYAQGSYYDPQGDGQDQHHHQQHQYQGGQGGGGHHQQQQNGAAYSYY